MRSLWIWLFVSSLAFAMPLSADVLSNVDTSATRPTILILTPNKIELAYSRWVLKGMVRKLGFNPIVITFEKLKDLPAEMDRQMPKGDANLAGLIFIEHGYQDLMVIGRVGYSGEAIADQVAPVLKKYSLTNNFLTYFSSCELGGCFLNKDGNKSSFHDHYSQRLFEHFKTSSSTFSTLAHPGYLMPFSIANGKLSEAFLKFKLNHLGVQPRSGFGKAFTFASLGLGAAFGFALTYKAIEMGLQHWEIPATSTSRVFQAWGSLMFAKAFLLTATFAKSGQVNLIQETKDARTFAKARSVRSALQTLLEGKKLSVQCASSLRRISKARTSAHQPRQELVDSDVFPAIQPKVRR